MPFSYRLLVPLCIGLSTACGSSPSGGPATGGSGGSGGSGGEPSPDILRRQGQQIVTGAGQPVHLRGMAFGNLVWSGPTQPPERHHDASAYAELAGIGMNAVRFYLNYQLFEDDAAPGQYKETGFAWIDQNIAWAKQHGVYLILNLHVPPGGFQSLGDGGALWDDPENQDRFVALWRAIAQRYRHEPGIAGYDLLNEPAPTRDRQQWIDLAERTIAAIRDVDPDHLIVLERTNAVASDWASDADMNFFLASDDNVLYEFHFYSPFEFTHQHASWTDLGEGGPYPDPTRISSGTLTWYAWTWEPEPPKLPVGDSDWAFYESEPYRVDDPKIQVGSPVLLSELNPGTAYFDGLVVKEYDAKGALVGTLFDIDLETLDDWSFWTAGETGKAAVSSDAHSGGASLTITATDHDASLSSPRFRFVPKQGHAYSVGVWMKGEGTGDLSRPDPRGDWTQNSRALARLDWYSGDVTARDAAGLKAEIDRFLAWGDRHAVPLYLGEFGAISACFEDDRGGDRWVRDMLQIARDAQGPLHWTYHTYHEPPFGLYQSDPATRLPDPADRNDLLLEVFRAELQK